MDDEKKYLDYELSRSQYKRELIKFLFFRLRDTDLSQDDYQYIFDFLYTLSDSQDRLKVMSRLYDTLFDRFRMKLVESNYREALLIRHCPRSIVIFLKYFALLV